MLSECNIVRSSFHAILGLTFCLICISNNNNDDDDIDINVMECSHFNSCSSLENVSNRV